MKLILFTAFKCPKCPFARKIVRNVASEIGWVEGRDFVEKLVDGLKVAPGEGRLENEKYCFVASLKEIKPEKTPAALIGEDFSLEALTYQIASTPSIVIREEAVFVGTVPTKKDLIQAIRERFK